MDKNYCKSVLRTRANQKALLLIKVLRRIANQKALKKINTNEEKYAIYKTDNKEPLVTDNSVTDEPSYFNLFECGNNILNRIDVTYKRACMTTSRDIFYTEIFKTLTDYNGRNNTPLLNEKIR